MASARAQGALRLKSLTRSWSSSALPATISPLIGLEKTAPRTRDDSDMEGTLRDVNVGVKDLFDLEEHVCGFGSPAFKAQFPEPAESDAAAVTALRRAGAHGFAPLHMDEMAFSLFGENANLGTPINFKSPSRVPGGSSSGCGSAVAGGLVDIALGSDTAGSIRVPASFCGAWGFRPTHGRVSVQGSRALAHSLDTVGLVARNAELLEKGMKVLLDTARDVEHAVPDDAESIFGGVVVASDAFDMSDTIVSTSIYESLSSQFSIWKRVLGPEEQRAIGISDDWVSCFRTVQGYEVWEEHKEWAANVLDSLGPATRMRMLAASEITRSEYLAACERRAMLCDQIDGILAGGAKCILLPTVPTLAPKLSSSADDLDTVRSRTIALNCIASLCGLPQCSIPVAVTEDGGQVGVSIIGATGNDEKVLKAASLIEQLTMR